MRLLVMFTRLCNKIGRFFGSGRPAAGNLAGGAAPDPSTRILRGPAVAGFAMRAHADRFFLARRIASVVKLNTPIGRKPRIASKRSVGHPPIPATRLAAKKVRLGANQGPRVLKPITAARPLAGNVIAFPVRATQPTTGLAQAA